MIRSIREISKLRYLLGVCLGLPIVSAAHAAEPIWRPSEVFSDSEQRRREGAGAVEEAEFETDRDSFTPATTTVREGQIMVESAWSYIDNREGPDTHSLPELVLRYGASDWFELRFGANHEVGGESGSVSGSEFGEEFVEDMTAEIERATAVSYGFKAFVSEQEVWLPQSSVIVVGTTPVSGAETASTVVCTYVWGWTFENGWKWDSAIRYGTGNAEGDRFNRWAPSTALKVPVAERWDLHAEYFAIFKEGSAADSEIHYVSPGAAYRLTDNLELGLRVGWGLSDDAAKFFSNVGVGWVF